MIDAEIKIEKFKTRSVKKMFLSVDVAVAISIITIGGILWFEYLNTEGYSLYLIIVLYTLILDVIFSFILAASAFGLKLPPPPPSTLRFTTHNPCAAIKVCCFPPLQEKGGYHE